MREFARTGDEGGDKYFGDEGDGSRPTHSFPARASGCYRSNSIVKFHNDLATFDGIQPQLFQAPCQCGGRNHPDMSKRICGGNAWKGAPKRSG